MNSQIWCHAFFDNNKESAARKEVGRQNVKEGEHRALANLFRGDSNDKFNLRPAPGCAWDSH